MLYASLHLVRITLTNARLSRGKIDPYIIYKKVLLAILKHLDNNVNLIAKRFNDYKLLDYAFLRVF